MRRSSSWIRSTDARPTDSPPYTVAGWFFDETTPAQRRTLVENGIDALAAVHAVDWKALGFEFLDKPQYGKLGFEQQLRYYEAAYDWADPGAEPPRIAKAALEWVQANAPAQDPELGLCWGDARINNQLFGPDFEVRAVVDWEMVTLADPMMDLGLVALPRPPLPRGDAGTATRGVPDPRGDGGPVRAVQRTRPLAISSSTRCSVASGSRW